MKKKIALTSVLLALSVASLGAIAKTSDFSKEVVIDESTVHEFVQVTPQTTGVVRLKNVNLCLINPEPPHCYRPKDP
jgi:hypothetical protein